VVACAELEGVALSLFRTDHDSNADTSLKLAENQEGK
jgi:hypothetical protein